MLPRAPLSHLLGRMLGESVGPVTIDQALDALGDRSFGGVMLVLALPALFMPPGLSALLGGPLMLVSGQLLVSRRKPWLPAVIGRRSLHRADAERVYAKASPILARTEGWVRPRLPALHFPLHDRLIAAVCMGMSLVLILPLPFAHTASALGIGAFGVGLMERDGLALVLGWTFAAACAGLTVAIVIGALAGLRLL